MKYIFFLSLLSLFSCSGNVMAQSKLTIEQTENMLKSDKTVQLVDLRTPDELRATGRIEGAKHIDFYSADFKTKISQLDKNKPVLVYCAAGGRSGQALAQFQQLGFKKVYDYSGGMSEWKAKGKKTVQ
jgi:rhodanese-related sulfurtransferase